MRILPSDEVLLFIHFYLIKISLKEINEFIENTVFKYLTISSGVF